MNSLLMVFSFFQYGLTASERFFLNLICQNKIISSMEKELDSVKNAKNRQ